MPFLPPLALLFALSAASPEGVVHLPAPEVEEAFARGLPLLEVEGFKVHASRRDGPGRAEVHERDTDIVYVLRGEAVLVTGGVLESGTVTALHEFRGSSIAGGTARRLRPGDVLVVPRGVPHWFREVTAPFLYYVVKVDGDGGAR